MFYTNTGTRYEYLDEATILKIHQAGEIIGLVDEVISLNQYGIVTRFITEEEKEKAKNYICEKFPKTAVTIYNISTTDFDTACLQFRTICNEIGTFIGVVDFKGGIEEYNIFINSSAYKNDKQTGLELAIKWIGADKACVHEANKLGIKSPDWWKICWNIN